MGRIVSRFRLAPLLVASSRGASRGYSFDLSVGSSRCSRQFARRIVAPSCYATRLIRLVASSRLAARQSSHLARQSDSAARCVVSSVGSVPRLVHRSSVFRLVWLIVPRRISRLVKQSVFFRFAWRLVSRLVVSGGVLHLVLFCSRFIRPFRLMAIMAVARHLRSRLVSWLRAPVPCCPTSSWGPGRWRKWACRSTI